MGATDTVSEAYEAAERSFLDRARSGADRAVVAEAASAVAEAARAWAAAAYRQFFALREALGDATREVVQAEIEAEQAEVLDSPWHDIAAAFAEGSSG